MPTVEIPHTRGGSGPQGTVYWDDDAEALDLYFTSMTIGKEAFDLSPDQFWEYRGYLQFDTVDAVPAGNKVTKIELKVKHAPGTPASTVGDPSQGWTWDIYMGTWIGATLTTAAWGGGGVEVLFHNWPSSPTDGYLDLGPLAVAAYDNDAVTDLEIRDEGATSSSPYYLWYSDLLNAVMTRNRQQLRITYEPILTSTIASKYTPHAGI